MKVSQKRKLIRVTIELESEKEIRCLKHLLTCDYNGLDYDDVESFQYSLLGELEEKDC